MRLTKYDALMAELEPYTPDRLTLLKTLADVSITDVEEEYNAERDKRDIALATVRILSKLIVLSSESLGKSSQSYNSEMLTKRIEAICADNDINAEDFVARSTISDASFLW